MAALLAPRSPEKRTGWQASARPDADGKLVQHLVQKLHPLINVVSGGAGGRPDEADGLREDAEQARVIVAIFVSIIFVVSDMRFQPLRR